jgi:2-polyprenyl-3-methyl-5-hydroxy-6-metoxy-1,4-benzoquinol methylase
MPCLYCQSSRAALLYKATDMYDFVFDVVQCQVCKAVYLSPMPTSEQLDHAYSDHYYGEQEKKFFSPFEWVLDYFRQQRANKLASYLPANGRVLDIGCGNGRFLHFVSQLGEYELHGVELPGKAAQRAAQIPNIHLKIGALERNDFAADTFDAITMFHVVEHLPNPPELLSILAQIVKPNGVAIISFPNIDSWQSRFFKGKWLHLDPPRHLYFFAPTDFSREMKKMGFETIETKYFNPEYNPFGLLQSLLNCFTERRDVLYEHLKNNRTYTANYSRFSLWLQILFFLAIFPFCILVDAVEAFFRKSGTVEMVFRKQ